MAFERRSVTPVPASFRSRASATPAWVLYLVAALGLTSVYFAFPTHHLLLWAPLGASSVVATVLGVRLNRPDGRLAWYLFAAALACFICGDTAYNVLTDVLHQDNPFPSVADAFYLTMYPLIAAGLLTLIRARSVTRDRGSLIDALTITTGLGLLSWVYLVLPLVHSDDLTLTQRVISIAYPLGDVLVMAMLARLIAGGVRNRSLHLLTLGTVGLLLADVAYGSIQLNGTWAVGGPVDAGWVTYYLAWGAAALHPSMRRVSDPAPASSAAVRGRQIALLAVVSLIAPGVLLSESLAGDASHASTIAIFSAVLYLLVVTRLAGMVSTHQASLQRERALRASGELLVAAQSENDVYLAAVSAVRRLTGGDRAATATIYVADQDGVRPVAGGPSRPPADVDPIDLWALAQQGGGLVGSGRVSVSPLRYDLVLRGVLAVHGTVAMTHDVHGALSTLASQVALALESLGLADEIRRRQSDAHFRGLIQNASDVILVLSGDGLVTYGTPSLQRELGRPPETLIGTPLTDLLHPDDVAPALHRLYEMTTAGSQQPAVADWRLCHADGTARPFEIMLSNLLDDANVNGVVLTMRDVSERRALQEQLTHQAFHDALTGLANRLLFRDRAEQALARLSRRGGTLAMVMLDLDDFKVVNDTLGHAAGDEMLISAARRLDACVRGGDTVARLGGDEFAVLMEDVQDRAEAESVAARLVHAIAEPLVVFGEELRAGSSAGVVVIGAEAGPPSLPDVLRRADLALYAAKENGKGQVVTYAEELHVRVLDRAAQKQELRRALDSEQFTLHYQPILEIGPGRIVGAEALVRWNHPDRGLLAPGDFIGLAEESAMIVELGDWVMDTALRQARTWRRHAGRPIRLSVNVSARQLQEPDFVARAIALMAQHDARPGSVIMEITESVLVRDGISAMESMDSLRAAGMQIAIDDFGVGYSSLAYLQDFPIDILKIDKSFIHNLGTTGRRGGALARAVLSLADSLRLEVIAEGIERADQRDELRSMGCVLGQGFLYARPMQHDEFVEALRAGAALGPTASAADHRAEPGMPSTLHEVPQ